MKNIVKNGLFEDVSEMKNGLIVDNYGFKYWYKDNEFHREDGPAVEYVSGAKEWWVNGELHREGGPALEHANGDKEWWVNGKKHREGGPAVEFHCIGIKEWWLNGEIHRENGPALEYTDDDDFKEYYYKGKHIECDSTEKFIKIIKLKAFW